MPPYSKVPYQNSTKAYSQQTNAIVTKWQRCTPNKNVWSIQILATRKTKVCLRLGCECQIWKILGGHAKYQLESDTGQGYPTQCVRTTLMAVQSSGIQWLVKHFKVSMPIRLNLEVAFKTLMPLILILLSIWLSVILKIPLSSSLIFLIPNLMTIIKDYESKNSHHQR